MTDTEILDWLDEHAAAIYVCRTLGEPGLGTTIRRTWFADKGQSLNPPRPLRETFTRWIERNEEAFRKNAG